ncbi:primosome assembly protein PriA [Corynebacterium yudongzhengii]|uniref:Probable replication restart protein PriA n=1 Tax=Corynebacterium yudongzhengii TaxID=2080740 RepID=A0A2U1T898_9CORY|nr:primosomal protein N' [Corynebacterium yudongzhengii]AWB81838.1 primosome assembly protein PriA [Corynebacterium yudongzhengii]PWC02231.1 primosomal protein N' [Corynebacterium yudongzhengii]
MASRSTHDIARNRPVARVLPLLGPAHLDRGFDYLVAEDQSATAQPGTKVRVRFAGRLVDALVLERLSDSDFDGNLRFIERVISPEVVYPERIAKLIDSLAKRYAGTRSDIIRLAIPPRHAGAEDADTTTSWQDLGTAAEPDLSAFSSYRFGESFVDAVIAGHTARAAWQPAPGEDWAAALAALAVKVAIEGRGALIVVPDQRDLDLLEHAVRAHVSARQVTVLHSGLGPQARYRRYLSILSGQARLVIGTRSAAFAPVKDLSLAVIVADGDDSHVSPLAPYPHVREILSTRSSIEQCSLVIASATRSAEAQLLVRSGWVHELVATRESVRARMPLIRAAGDSEFEMIRDPRARSARLPLVAFEAARKALDRDEPVLIQVPRKGYIPVLACGNCRAPARCRACNGPLGLPPDTGETGSVPTCRWCGRPDSKHRCGECGSPKLRAVVLGSERTAEELGRAFPSTPVVHSGGNRIVDTIEQKTGLVVATPGAEPVVAGGGYYGAGLLLDTWALLGRQDLRAGEDTLAKWVAVANRVAPQRAGGEVIVVADPGLRVVQEFVRWDVVDAAERELAERGEVGFPPTVHMAAVDGAHESLERFRSLLELPEGADILGPVDLPANDRLPGEYDEKRFGPAQRILVRTPLGPRSQLGEALKAAAVARSLRKDDLPLRIRVDPVKIG